jgi:MarR family transcriptional regulator, lower aerobic nicotinate degradation pathway regulator
MSNSRRPRISPKLQGLGRSNPDTKRPGQGGRRKPNSYVLEDQVGFLLRAASQRNTVLFAKHMVGGLTRVQFAAVAKLLDIGSCSQNELGRLILLDRATIKGVVSRLRKRGLIDVQPHAKDRRQHVLGLTKLGQRAALRGVAVAPGITEKMLERLNPPERKQIVQLLRKMLGKSEYGT